MSEGIFADVKAQFVFLHQKNLQKESFPGGFFMSSKKYIGSVLKSYIVALFVKANKEIWRS